MTKWPKAAPSYMGYTSFKSPSCHKPPGTWRDQALWMIPGFVRFAFVVCKPKTSWESQLLPPGLQGIFTRP